MVQAANRSTIKSGTMLPWASCAVAVMWAIGTTAFLLGRTKERDSALRHLAESEQRASEFEKKASDATARAHHLETSTAAFRLREEKKLYQIYPKLKKLEMGKNVVNDRYVESFTYDGRKVRLKLSNKGTASVTPRFELFLIDENGFVTGNASVTWLIESLEPDESRVEEQETPSRFGLPVYYMVRFPFL